MHTDDSVSIIAILLAGGKGTRLRQSGRGRPKPLLDIAGEPVINFIVRKLLALDGQEHIDKIYVLLRKRQRLPKTAFHPVPVELDLQREFNLWEENWFWEEKDRIDLVYEEDLDEPPLLKRFFPDGNVEGAIAGLARWLWDSKAPQFRPDARVILAAADNFLPDEDFSAILRLCAPGISVNAYKDLGDPEKIREKFGCLSTTRADDGTEWLRHYLEKPANPGPKDTKASVALYCFPIGHVRLLREYVESLKSTANPQVALGAPGFFLQWLAGKTSEHRRLGEVQTEGVKAHAVRGRWFDIGDPADLRIATYWHTHSGRLETVEDLIVARETNQLDDNSFLLVRRMEIDSATRTIRIWHATDDGLCCFRSDARRLSTVSEIRSEGASDKELWLTIHKGLQGESPMPKQKLSHPLLLSAGVFFFDCDGSTPGGKLNADRALLPVLEKDLASKLDRRRLTTPAGRVDSLDVQQVCLDEMREEFVFYGTGSRGTPVVFCPVDASDQAHAAREAVLSAVRKGRLAIPGISLGDLDVKDAADVFTEEVRIFPLEPSFCWTLEIFLDRQNADGTPMERRAYARPGFVVIPDKDNHTLEFRIIRWGNITGVQRHRVEPTKSTMQLGRLSGVGDGDGYHRIPLVFSGAALLTYWQNMAQVVDGALQSVLRKSQLEAASVLAAGDGQNGRFARFDVGIPLLFTTTAVDYLLERLGSLLE